MRQINSLCVNTIIEGERKRAGEAFSRITRNFERYFDIMSCRRNRNRGYERLLLFILYTKTLTRYIQSKATKQEENHTLYYLPTITVLLYIRQIVVYLVHAHVTKETILKNN